MPDPTATPLPDDVETLKAMLRDTMTQRDAAIIRGNAATDNAEQAQRVKRLDG